MKKTDKKTVGILTYYDVHNHGAVLQANAIKTVLANLGFDCYFLRFSRNYDFISDEQKKKYKIGLDSIFFFIRYAIERGLSNLLFNLIKNRRLNKYRKQNFSLFGSYADYNGEYVVIGSDEVFSTEIGINHFFYGHGISASKIISYAASFGPSNYDFIKKHNLINLVSSGLKNMYAVSVRDMNSCNITEKLGVNSEIVCDPVILYGYEKEQNEYKPNIENYIVIYSYDKNMNDIDEVVSIKRFAKSNCLKILSVGYHHKWCDKNINATPEQLLGYIKNAELVITDTFHGTVLSLICNTDFIVKLRGNSNKLGFLLEEYNLTNRTTDRFENIEDLYQEHIDYTKVNEIIFDKREKSLKFLRRSLIKEK